MVYEWFTAWLDKQEGDQQEIDVVRKSFYAYQSAGHVQQHVFNLRVCAGHKL
jgi:hypothetical protein